MRIEQQPAPRATGRPKRQGPPRRATTVRIEEDNDAWINDNLPRSRPLSDFINEALRTHIAMLKAKRAARH